MQQHSNASSCICALHCLPDVVPDQHDSDLVQVGKACHHTIVWFINKTIVQGAMLKQTKKLCSPCTLYLPIGLHEDCPRLLCARRGF